MGLVNGRQFTLRRLTDFEEPVPFLTFLSLPHIHIFVSFPPHSQLSAVCNRFTLVLFLQLVLTIEVLHLSKETSASISFVSSSFFTSLRLLYLSMSSSYSVLSCLFLSHE